MSLGFEIPDSGTQIHQATEVLDESIALDDPNRVNIGTIISDGIPDNKVTTILAAEKLCELRDRTSAPIVSYMVGFGSAVFAGRGKRILDFLAATGGTGECCYKAAWPCSDSFKVDPCTRTNDQLQTDILDDGGIDDSTYIYEDWNCDGSLSALDGDALKNELLQIVGDAACIFPLDIPPGYPTEPAAKDDPDATNVVFDHSVWGPIATPFCRVGDVDCGLEANLVAAGIDPTTAALYKDEGWYFIDTQRTHVRVSDLLCDEVATGNVSTVKPRSHASVRKKETHVFFNFDATLTNEQVMNARCSDGIFTCPDGSTDVCVGQYADMPETCNGVDDDCNGVVDDLEQSWTNPLYSSSIYEIPPGSEGIACLETNVCECESGAKDPIAGTTPLEYYQSWGGACTCSNALEVAEFDQPSSPERENEPATACNFTGPLDGNSVIWLMLLGLLLPIGYEKVRRR